jgi:hypothetical protein
MTFIVPQNEDQNILFSEAIEKVMRKPLQGCTPKAGGVEVVAIWIFGRPVNFNHELIMEFVRQIEA